MLARDLPCAILAIDPGEVSGWATSVPPLRLPGESRWELGVAKTWRERQAVVLQALGLAAGVNRPLVVVAETWRASGAKKGRDGRESWNSETIAGLGARWGLWLAELQRADVPPRRIVRVDTGTWTQVVLGGVRVTTEQRRARSILRAKAVTQRADVQHDEAAALCIGLWGMRAEKVASAIGKRELKRLGWDGLVDGG